MFLLLLLPLALAMEWRAEVCPEKCVCAVRYSTKMQADLRTVDCEGQGLKSLPEGREFPIQTQVLNLARNRIHHLSQIYLPELLHLDLSSNQIRTVPRSTFEGAYNLRVLDLSRNRIGGLMDAVFEGLYSLKELDLSQNRISRISDNGFQTLEKLEILNLSGNRLTLLQNSWWTHLPSLYELKLKKNHLSILQSRTFESLQNLLGLDLSGNKLFHINNNAFEGLRKLEYLRLDENRLLTVPSTAFVHVRQTLKSLSINNNPIYRLKTDSFADLEGLRDLSLINLHRLHFVDSKAFSRLPQLLILELHDNKHFSYLDPNAFSDIPRLTHILVHNNNLSALPESVAFDLPSLDEVTFYGNPILCDCNVQWIKTAISGGKLARFSFQEAEKMVCTSPERHAFKLLAAMDQKEISETCPPTILGRENIEIDARFGDEITIDCKAIGVPYPSVEWRSPSGHFLDVGNQDTRLSLRNGGSTLVIANSRKIDTGLYTCIAENAHGEIHRDFHVSVSDFDVALKISRISPGSVTLNWTGKDRDRGIFQILYRQTRPGSSHEYAGTVTPIMTSYTVTSLQPQTNYEICLAAEDHNSVMVYITCTNFTTKGLAHLVSGIERTSNIAVGTAMGIIACMLIVTCLALVGLKWSKNTLSLPLNTPGIMENVLLVPPSPGVASLPKTPALDNVYSGFCSTEKLLGSAKRGNEHFTFNV